MTFVARILVSIGLALLLASSAQAGNRAKDAAIYEQNGKALFESEQWAEAAAQFAAAYTQGNDPAMLFNMALCHRRAGNSRRALGLYQRYLLEAPPGPNRMVAQSRIQEVQQELAAGERGARPTKDAAAYEQDGKSLYESGRWADAAGAYEAAYNMGKDPGMLHNMALCLRRAGDAKRALEVYRQYLVEAPDTPKRASVEARIKELQQELEPAGKRGPKPVASPSASSAKDAATYEQNAKKLYEAGRWAEAASEFEGAYKLGKDSALLYNMALCHRRAGNATRALELYQQYLAEVPDTPKRANVESRIQELRQELAVGPNAVPPASAGGGCTKDSECKGTRICEQGRCVEQQAQLVQSMAAPSCDPPCGPGRICSDAGACVAGQGGANVEDTAISGIGPSSYAFGAGLGYASGGSVSVDGSSLSPDGGFVLDLYFDKLVAPALSMGAYLTRSSMSVSHADASYLSLGGTIKARFELSKTVHLRPGLTFGYNRMSSSLFPETVTGMNIGMHVDLAIATSNTFAVVPRLGFFTQPSGGAPSFDVTFGPHFYLAFAAEFGK